MKIISFILTIYFLGLSTITCSDSSGRLDNYDTTATYVHIDVGQDTDHHGGDVCSPLCMCHCCGGVTLVYYTEYQLLSSVTLSPGQSYLDCKPSDLSYSIWQPPKIS